MKERRDSETKFSLSVIWCTCTINLLNQVGSVNFSLCRCVLISKISVICHEFRNFKKIIYATRDNITDIKEGVGVKGPSRSNLRVKLLYECNHLCPLKYALLLYL